MPLICNNSGIERQTAETLIERKTKMSTAKEILNQLGGNKFIAMTGARNLGATENSLCFKLPRGFAKDSINLVKVELDLTDTYTVHFFQCGRP